MIGWPRTYRAGASTSPMAILPMEWFVEACFFPNAPVSFHIVGRWGAIASPPNDRWKYSTALVFRWVNGRAPNGIAPKFSAKSAARR